MVEIELGNALDVAISESDTLKVDVICGYEDDRSKSLIGIDADAGVIFLEPTGVDFIIYSDKKKFTITSRMEIPFDKTYTGIFWAYVDASGNLIYTKVFSWNVVFRYAFTALGYYNSTQDKVVTFCDERHSFERNNAFHQWAHQNIGTKYTSGLQIGDIVCNAVTDGLVEQSARDAIAQFSVSDGWIADEDLEFETTGSDINFAGPLVYSDVNGHWNTIDPSGFAVHTLGGRAVYNKDGVLTEAPSNSYICAHIVSLLDFIHPVQAIIGTAVYTDIASAEKAAGSELLKMNMDGLPTAEMKAIGTIVFRVHDIFDNAVKCNIAALSNDSRYRDWRNTRLNAATHTEVHIPQVDDSLQGYLDNMAIDQPIFSPCFINADGGISVTVTVADSDVLRFFTLGIQREMAVPFDLVIPSSHDVEQDGIPPRPYDISFSFMYLLWSDQGQEIIASTAPTVPTGPLLSLGYIGVQSPIVTVTNDAKPILFQRTTECITHGGAGAIARMRENARLASNDRLWDGCQTNLVRESNGDLGFEILDGVFYQMNQQYFRGVKTNIDGFYPFACEEGAVTPFSKQTDLQALKYTQNGTEMVVDKFYIFFVYAIGNSGEENQKAVVRTPRFSFDSIDEAERQAVLTRAPKPPKYLKSVAFPVSAIVIKYKGVGVFENGFNKTVTTTENRWDSQDIWYTSPNYPNGYGTNLALTRQLDTPYANTTKAQVIFVEIDTETSYDYLYGRAQASPTTTYYDERYTGHLGAVTSRIFNTVNFLRFLFTTDGSVSKRGFKSIKVKWLHLVTILDTEETMQVIDLTNNY